MRPFDVALREPFPQPPAMARLTTVMNGRHVAIARDQEPVTRRSDDEVRYGWRRFVQMLNQRGEPLGDE